MANKTYNIYKTHEKLNNVTFKLQQPIFLGTIVAEDGFSAKHSASCVLDIPSHLIMVVWAYGIFVENAPIGTAITIM